MRYHSCMDYCFVSPLGPIAYRWQQGICCRIRLLNDYPSLPASDDPVSHWLSHWFAGRSLPLPPRIDPATPFQAKLRNALSAIPFGERYTYGALAADLNSSPRAVGQALGANPLPIMIPCHRIVAANGPGGFACGPTWKSKLLQFEAAVSKASGRNNCNLKHNAKRAMIRQ